MRRWLAGRIHAFAWFLDRVADRIWNDDELFRTNLSAAMAPFPSPGGEEVAAALNEALAEIHKGSQSRIYQPPTIERKL